MPQSRRHKYTYPKISEEDEKFVVRSPYPDVDIPECNMADFVWKNVEQWPEHVALVRDPLSAIENLIVRHLDIVPFHSYNQSFFRGFFADSVE